LLLLFLVIVFPFLVITIYSTYQIREEAMGNARQRTLQLVETVVVEQRNVEVGTRQLLSTLAKLPEFQKRNVERCTEIFRELSKQNSMYTNLLLADTQGNAIASAKPFNPFSIKHRKYFQEVLKTMDFSVGEYAVAIVATKPVLHYAYPVMDSNNVLKGILVAAIDLDNYEEIFKKAGLPPGSNLAITDHKGVRLFRYPVVKETVGQNDLPEMMAFMSGPDEKGTFLTTGVDGVNRLYAFSRIRLRAQDPPYMFVRVGIPEAGALAGANEMLKRNILIIGLTILASILFAWYLGKVMFIGRLEQLNAFAGRVQKGETGVRTAVPHTGDEFGMLARSFDKMAEVIEERDREKEQAHERLNEIIEFLPDATFVIDADRKVIAWNRAIEQMTGIPKDDLVGKGNYEYAIAFYGERRPILIDLAFLPDAEFENEKYDAVHRIADTLCGEVYVPKIYGGKGAYLSATASRLRDASGSVIGAIESIRDITERKRAELALRASEEKYRSLASSVDSMYLVDRDCRYMFMNEGCLLRFGLPLEDIIGKRYNDFHSGENSKQFAKTVEEVFETGKPIQVEYQSERDQSYLLRTFSPVKDHEGKSIIAVTISSKGITDLKWTEGELRESENRYRELSIIDDLTQLYNSRYFYQQLKMEIDRAGRYKQPLTLLVLDLDSFKQFNDAYGHVEGDQVLSRFGQVVKKCLRQTDSAYRYGGEEFTILLPMTTSTDGAVNAERIRTEFKKEKFSPVSGKDVHMTVSIGLAQYKPQEDMKTFVHRVDQLMYQAKKNGKDRVCPES
jgi:diguanylate cyclase (GGDEF)-like protein/PAS domain S-box-containing protein